MSTVFQQPGSAILHRDHQRVHHLQARGDGVSVGQAAKYGAGNVKAGARATLSTLMRKVRHVIK